MPLDQLKGRSFRQDCPRCAGYFVGQCDNRYVVVAPLQQPCDPARSLRSGNHGSNKENARHRALGLIKDEHRSLSAVVHALQHLTRQMSEGMEPNQTLLGAIAHYLLQFPEKLHHPAEDRYLFAPLRARTSESKDVLDKLEAEHAAGDDRAAKLSAALNELAARSPDSVAHFKLAVEEYANFYWAHMICEETLVLPLAERVLSEEDWLAAADGFAANHDPLYGTDTANEFDALFMRIVYMAPAPIGLGG